MTKTTATALLVSLALLSLGGAATAQDQPGMVRVITVHVKLGHQQHFESTMPKIWEALRKAGGKSPYFVSAGVSDPGAYVLVVPMNSFADLEAQEKTLNQAFGSVPDVTAESFGATTSVDDEIWLDRPDLAYQPAQQRVPVTEQTFMHIALLYADPGQIPALEATLKERNELRKKNGITDAVGVAQLLIGADGPAYAIMTGAKDQADFYTQNAKNIAKIGKDWQASLDKSGPMLRRVEFVTSVAKPALDYKP